LKSNAPQNDEQELEDFSCDEKMCRRPDFNMEKKGQDL